MTQIFFLLPPSEGKNSENKYNKEELSFELEKPLNIAKDVTEKDLKCKGNRFIEGLELNKSISDSKTNVCIKRYSGVMYNAIDYSGMTKKAKGFFEKNFLILSGMYGILRPLDKIGNYKLPIETKGLLDFWGTKIIEEINDLKIDCVVNLLPISYSKLIFGKNKKQEKDFNKIRNFKIININFLSSNTNIGEKKEVIFKKVSHGVKKIKGEWIKDICEKNIQLVEAICGQIDILLIEDFKSFTYEIIDNGNGIIDINILVN